MKKFVNLLFVILTTIFISGTSIKALEGDTTGDIFGVGGGCSGKDSCWLNMKDGDNLYGIRVTIVDGNGNMVSSKSIDYIGGSQDTVNYINTNTTYYRCINSNSNIRNRLGYLNGSVSCSWQAHNGVAIAEYLSWLPNIYSTKNSADYIKTKILSMDTDELKQTFFEDIGYNLEHNRQNLENHYLIIEPLTLIEFGSTKRYGTYYELAPMAITYNWVWSVGTVKLPFSIYLTGNTNIEGPGGYDNSNQTYFKGKIKIAKDTYKSWNGGKGRYELEEKYIKDQSYGYGIGVYWLKEFEIEVNTCDYNNAEHFSTANSGPNEENCCTYVKNNLSQYGLTEAQFYTKYPQCNSVLNSCTFDLTTKYPTCNVNTNGKISDITNWECIYASAYSNDPTIKNYFLKYGVPTDSCSVYCRNEITYMYPSNNMITLAGNYFTIANSTNAYYEYLDPTTNELKIKAATLGPIQISVKKDCSILGDKNNSTCQNQLQEELNNISAPTVEFAYESAYYNNPTETLASTSSETTGNNNGIQSRTVTYTYVLPSSTYKYVSKNTGISYKNISSIGKYPYIEIGSHSPIHFSQESKTANYQITIKKFNLSNFDKLILNGQTMSTKFDTSIETYIKTLIDNDQARPTNINGIYYLDKTFVGLLNKNGFSAQDLLNTTCAHTDNYDCYSNENGIFCYDKGKTSNSFQTYAYFNSCINNQVQNIKHAKENYKNDMLYTCTFEIENKILDQPQPDNPKNTPGDINIIYRPISLDNPFPSIDGDGRETGSNWCYIEDCSNTNPVVQNIITNNRDVQTEKIYRELDPLYTITLTPAVIKEIRKYNNKTTYDDFNLVCDSNGENCKSDFIRNNKYNFSKYFSGCGIGNKSIGLKCQDSDKW